MRRKKLPVVEPNFKPKDFRIGDTVIVREGRYGFKEYDLLPKSEGALKGKITEIYDRFCVVEVRYGKVSPFYDDIEVNQSAEERRSRFYSRHK